MELTHEAIASIRNLADEARGIAVVDLPKQRKTVVRRGDKYETLEYPPPVRSISVAGLDDLFEQARADESGAREVYYNAQRIDLLFDAVDRRERAYVTLAPTARWAAIMGLQSGRVFDQQSVIEFLRFSLADTGPGTVQATTALRSIDFSRRVSGGATVDHGRNTFGRRVEAQVDSPVGAIPTEFEASAPLWCNPGCRKIVGTVRIGIELRTDGEAAQIVLRLIGDTLQDAHDLAVDNLGGLLRERFTEDKCPALVVQGTPGSVS